MRALAAALDQHSQAVAERTGISRAELRCLELVSIHPGVTAGDLARLMHVTPSVVTASTERLVQLGHLRRNPDPRDRRRVILGATDRAKSTTRRVYGGLGPRLASVLDGRSQAERSYLVAALRGIGEGVAAHTSHLRRKQAR